MKPFHHLFITVDESFNFNNTAVGHVHLDDRPSGLRFSTSLMQDESMCFIFQKKHQSQKNKSLSFKTNFQLKSKPPVRIFNTNYFNYYQEVESLVDVDYVWFQNRLEINPEEG